MASTIKLDPSTWDLTLDDGGNIAVLDGADALAQDAASAIKTFLGELYWNTAVGVPYLTQIFGKNPPLALLKQELIDAALTVPDVASAQVFITSTKNRVIAGQVQVVSGSTGESGAADFATVTPIGVG